LLKTLETVKPGYTLINEKVQLLRKGQEVSLNGLTDAEISLMREKFDDYIMYIWLHLGDTRFNRHGYRTATDILCKTLKLNRRN